MTAIHRLVYASRNRIPGPPAAQEAEIRAILAASRDRNARAGVTGALLFTAGGFGQILEGPRAAVEATFERIQRDDRHGEVTLLAFEPAPARAFAQWSMTYVGQDRAPGGLAGLGAATGFDPTRLTQEEVFGHLLSLVREGHEMALL